MKKVILFFCLLLLIWGVPSPFNTNKVIESEITIAVLAPYRDLFERDDRIVKQTGNVNSVLLDKDCDVLSWNNGDNTFCIIKEDGNTTKVINPATNESIALFNNMIGEEYIPVIYDDGLICLDENKRLIIIDSNGMRKELYNYSFWGDDTITSLSFSDQGIIYCKSEKGEHLEKGKVYLFYHDELIEVDDGYLPFWYKEGEICYIKNKRVYIYCFEDKSITPLCDKKNRHITIEASPYWTDKIVYGEKDNGLFFTTYHATSFLGITIPSVSNLDMDVEFVSLSDCQEHFTISVGTYISSFFVD